MAKHFWGAYDSVGDYLHTKLFYSRAEAREYCKGMLSGVKPVKIVIQLEKKRQKKEEVEYFAYNNFYYKIENGKVYTYWWDAKCWDVIPSCTTPEWVRKNMTKVDFNEIRNMTEE